ncbi:MULTISPECIES: MBL fold metallo-hydrolase [Salinibaculum]|uniref:MBL fold metallo-hydrolase n=1 Tax=Salinibaculum TaxID=2732368 RepID=UPI0030CDC1C2
MTVTHDDLTVDWLGYATLRIEHDETVVYVDPGRYGVLTGEWTADSDGAAAAHPPAREYRPEDGDVVCLTHVHHYDPDGIERVAADDATVLAFEGINVHDTQRTDTRLADLPYEVREVGMNAEGVVDDVLFWTVEAYNEPDGPHTRGDGTPIHPKGLGCGFLLSVGGTRVFCPGDTDVLDGHEALDVSLFCPPIGGTFTMDRHEAATLAEEMDPDLVVPVHYNTFAAIETDSAAFAEDLRERGVAVELDET